MKRRPRPLLTLPVVRRLSRWSLVEAGSIAGLVGLGIVLLCWAIWRPYLSGDTRALVLGAESIFACARDGSIGNCPETAHFALLQYLPAAFAVGLGAETEFTIHTLAVLSALAVGAVVYLTLTVLAKIRPGLKPLAVIVLVSSPLIWYAAASFSEALQMAVLSALVAALLLRKPPWTLVLLATLAGITKETVLPFLIALIGAAIAARPGRFERGDWRRVVLPSAVGVLISVVLTAAFNVFRFGTLTNTFNLGSDLRTPGWALRSDFFGALFVSPNGGLLVVWPAFVAVLLGSLSALVVKPRGRRTGAISVLICVLIVVFSAVGLSLWFAPFGWIAWGPRLLLPLLPALVLLVAVAANNRFAAWTRAPWGLLTIAVAGIWGFLLNLGATADAVPLLGRFFAPTGQCINAVIQTNPTGYFDCMGQLMWAPSSVLVDAFASVANPGTALVALIGIGTLGLWVLRLKESTDGA